MVEYFDWSGVAERVVFSVRPEMEGLELTVMVTVFGGWC